MPAEQQVVQIFAATNGYLDRIDVDKVERFLADLIDSVRSSESDLLKTIAGGDWSDQTQEQLEQAIKSFSEDFGYDLDEEGHALEDEDEKPRHHEQDSRAGSDSNGESGEEQDKDKEEEAVPA
jgi:F-type H+-transporting ATPase subunit alpha